MSITLKGGSPPMPQPPPVVGIYARKSKFSETSESVANQVSMCREHCERVFPGCSFVVYDEDEGYSGKNTNRPSFQRLVADIKARKVNVLCCYRLDRISRSIRDFCTLLDDLQRYGVSFVSLRDQFDTSTPMGRAMMYIASVFSQLERETIAERVRDSLYEMAKTGRWLGGNTPNGFTATPIETQRDGVTRRMWMLTADEEPLAQVVDLFVKFAEFGSVSKLLSYCLQHGIKSQNGLDFSRTTLRLLLSNPVYCCADSAAWDYFTSGDFNLCATREDFDGLHGIMPFNRTAKVSDLTVKKATGEWIIAVGRHPGAVPGAIWVRAQRILEENRDKGKGWQAPRTEAALLSGVIRCAHCGSFMRPKVYGKPLPDGSRRFHYICNRKLESRGECCSVANAPGIDVDAMVIQQLRELSSSHALFSQDQASGQFSRTGDQDVQPAIRRLETDLADLQRKLDNVTETVAEGVPASARVKLLQRMEELDAQICKKQKAIADLNASEMASRGQQDLLEHLRGMLSSFGDSFVALSHDQKRRFIRAIVDEVSWDGEYIDIHVFGEKTLPK